MPPEHLHDNDVTLAILAGGEGARMGKPKGLLTINGRPILDHLLDQLQWAGPTMLVTAPGREHPPACQRFTREVTDPHAGGGPLRGVLTALENVRTNLLLLLTVDMPAIQNDQLALLLEALRSDEQTLGVMMRRTLNGREQVEPFPCAMRSSAKPVIARRLAEGRKSIRGLLDEPGFMSIQALPEWDRHVWANLNSPTDMALFSHPNSA